MKHGKHVEALEEYQARGVAIKILDERPEIETDFEWIWKAFNRLGTTRPIGMSVGQISYTVVIDYGDRLGVGNDVTEFLWDVIHRVDLRYLGLLRDQTPSTPGAKRNGRTA